MYPEMNGRTVVITGGTSGLGYGISKAFLEQGAKVIAIYLQDDKKAKNSTEELSPLGNFKAVKANITDEEQIKAVFASLSVVDYLVNCAGISHEDEIIKLPIEQVRAVFETNIIGKIIVSRCAFPLLRKSKYPRIVNIASRFAERPLATAIPLTATEAGIVMFTKNLALEWAEYGIKVNSVAPSLTRTKAVEQFYTPQEFETIGNRNPSKRLGKLEDTSNAVLFLCSEKADYINGENLNVNGGILLV
jgi:3-oxoacyl-[acyl-carrier protein] reductase